MSLKGADGGKFGLAGSDVGLTLGGLFFAEIALRVWWQSWAHLMGLYGHHLPDMDDVAKAGHSYYNQELRGGEGHMEVAKLIINVVNQKAHMTLSVKPFGCMPSSGVSDGVQSLITTKYPGTVFCAVETSGDGATNFYSRVQMYLYKARIAAEEELKQAFVKTGVSEEHVRAFLRDNPDYASPLHHSPHTVAGSAANLVYEVAPHITMSRRQRLQAGARALAKVSVASLEAAPKKARRVVAALTDRDNWKKARLDLEIVGDLARGKAREHYEPLVKKLLGRAYWENNPEAPAVEEPLAAE
jgi:hypothetical protein